VTWQDPYLWPNTNVLRNKAGITSAKELALYESNYTQFRTWELKENPIPGGFDIQKLCGIHQHLFQDVYDFAGQIRTINISKGDMFANVPEITRLSEYLFTQLQKEKFLTNLSPHQFAERAALYFNAINAIHPFREGNGRTQRIFMEQLAKEAGHTLNLEAVSNKITMVDASKQGIAADIDGVVAFDTQRPILFIDMFQKAVNPAYVDIMQQARAALAKELQMPELIPNRDGERFLTVQGIVLAKNDRYTAQMHGMEWFTLHPNDRLLEPLQPGDLAMVQYDQQGIGTVKQVGKTLEFSSPAIPFTHEFEQAKPVTRLDTVYHGKLVHIDNNHVYQELGLNNVIKHQKSVFPPGQLPQVGKVASIKYQNGQAKVITKEANKNIKISR